MNINKAMAECRDMLDTLAEDDDAPDELDTEAVVRQAEQCWSGEHTDFDEDRVGWTAAHILRADDLHAALVGFLARVAENER